MRKLLCTLFAAALASAACAQPAAQAQRSSGPPRLLVVISIDQLSADLFDEYRPHFTGGLLRASRGVAFRNGYQAHAATETCPGHSTLLTGSYPANNGIIANTWVDQSIARANKTVYCAEDETRAPPPGGAVSYTPSPVHLHRQTLGDFLKQRSPASLNVAVGGKDRAAIMMSGHRADQRWFWERNRFTTDLATAIPATMRRANIAVASAIATPRQPLTPPPVCAAKATPTPVSNTLTVGTGRFARAAGDARGFQISPELDAATLAIAAGLVQDLRLGADAAVDILSINLAATDYVGHAYGTGGSEMCLQLLSLDRDLAGFFRVLDQQRIDYAVVLTADHGSPDIPERTRAKGLQQAARADVALAADVVGKAIGTKLGLTGPVLLGSIGGDVYLDRGLRPADRNRAEREAIAFYTAHPQVQAVFTSRQLRSMRLPTGAPDRWSVAQRVRASFDPQRSGDLYVVLKQHVMPIATPSTGYVATHGTVWDYDRRVPILFWRPGMAAVTRNDAVSTVDILPTVQAMLGLPTAPRIDGHCIRGIQGVSCPGR